MLRTAVFLSTAQGQLATIQDSFNTPAASSPVPDADESGGDIVDAGDQADDSLAETSALSQAGADDSIIA